MLVARAASLIRSALDETEKKFQETVVQQVKTASTAIAGTVMIQPVLTPTPPPTTPNSKKLKSTSDVPF